MMTSTPSAKTADAVKTRVWFVVDATDKPLGRLASEIARVLRGKHKPTFTPHVDTGDFVIVVNAGKVKLTGNKLDKKFYYHHSGIPGGFKAEAYRHLIERQPELPIEKAVRGMLPKNVLGRQMLTKLKVYATPDHPHAAQQPKPLEVHL
jgi:large subunit ribosomal protein L13